MPLRDGSAIGPPASPDPGESVRYNLTLQSVGELTASNIQATLTGPAGFPGFVSNRVLMPMINEAVFSLMEGVAEAEAIDTVMKLGMAHPMGPLALADLIGLDTVLPDFFRGD